MIIRSQNKKVIVNLSQVTDIFIEKAEGMSVITVCFPYELDNDCANVTIAKYSTEEKAIEVLDGICKHIRSGWEICEMPQDKEVQDDN